MFFYSILKKSYLADPIQRSWNWTVSIATLLERTLCAHKDNHPGNTQRVSGQHPVLTPSWIFYDSFCRCTRWRLWELHCSAMGSTAGTASCSPNADTDACVCFVCASRWMSALTLTHREEDTCSQLRLWCIEQSDVMFVLIDPRDSVGGIFYLHAKPIRSRSLITSTSVACSTDELPGSRSLFWIKLNSEM